MLRSHLCVKRAINVTATNAANRRHKMLTFNDNATFISCISKINNTFIDNAEDLDIVMSMYNLLEYSDNYCMTSESLWSYYRDEVNDSANGNNDANNIG